MRDRQNIPLPLGGMAPARVRRVAAGRVGARLDRLLMVLAGGCAVAGLVLLAAPTTDTASLVAGQVEVGSMVLAQVGPLPASRVTLYSGDASYALVERADGSASAAAAWSRPQPLSAGTCDLQRAGRLLVDRCTFTGPAARVTAVDVLDPAVASSWRRTYADGLRVSIAVAPDGAVVPVPFPVGR